MPLVVVGVPKGSTGATTTAVVLGQCTPGPAVIAECDIAGGDLAARFELSTTPGLAGLADSANVAAVWPQLHQSLFPAHQLAAVVSAVGDWETLGALDWSTLAAVMAASPELVIADVGRLGPGPFECLAPAAEAVVLVVRRDLASLRHAQHVLPSVVEIAAGTPVCLILVGDSQHPWTDKEVAIHVGVEVIGSLPWIKDLSAPQRRSSPPDLRGLHRRAKSICQRLAQLRNPIQAAADPNLRPLPPPPPSPTMTPPPAPSPAPTPIGRWPQETLEPALAPSAHSHDWHEPEEAQPVLTAAFPAEPAEPVPAEAAAAPEPTPAPPAPAVPARPIRAARDWRPTAPVAQPAPRPPAAPAPPAQGEPDAADGHPVSRPARRRPLRPIRSGPGEWPDAEQPNRKLS